MLEVLFVEVGLEFLFEGLDYGLGGVGLGVVREVVVAGVYTEVFDLGREGGQELAQLTVD